MNLNIGDVVTLKIGMLGNKPGTRGVVYEEYPDFDDIGEKGVSIIFENGNYDGFSFEDQDLFLEKENVINISNEIKNYKFEHVMKLSKDFDNGLWDEIFR